MGESNISPSSPQSSRGSRLLSRVLPTAMRLWLLSQVEHVEALALHIEGRDRDLLSGHVPAVSLSAQKAVYRGIHLSQIALQASTIRVNLGQVMRRQPLRLLAPFPLAGTLRLTEADLNASLQAPLLGEGLYQFLARLAAAQAPPTEAPGLQAVLAQLPEPTVLSHYTPRAVIGQQEVQLRFMPKLGQRLPPFAIATQLAIADQQRLCLRAPRWLQAPTAGDLAGFEVDLGEAVSLNHCVVAPGEIALTGAIQVNP